MRILVLTPFLPDKNGSHGGSVYLGTYLEHLAGHAEVALASLVPTSGADQTGDLSNALARVELVAHPRLRDLRGPARWMHKLRMLLGWGLRRRPLLVAKHYSRAFESRVAALAAEFSPDVVVLEQAVMAQYLPLFNGTPTVLADHERGDALPADIGLGQLGVRRDAELWSRYVRHLYPRASLLQALNTEDAIHLARLLDRDVEVRTLVVPLPATVADPASTPPRALFLGNYLHDPNTEAVVHLVHEVWPAVRDRHPDGELWLAGANAGAELTRLAREPGVRLVGEVDDLSRLFADVRLLLAPLFSGGGVRVKVLTAMAHGLPIVSNQLGLRGLDVAPPAARSAETPAELAAVVGEYFEQPATAREHGRAARAWIETHVSPAVLAQSQLERLRQLTGRVE